MTSIERAALWLAIVALLTVQATTWLRSDARPAAVNDDVRTEVGELHQRLAALEAAQARTPTTPAVRIAADATDDRLLEQLNALDARVRALEDRRPPTATDRGAIRALNRALEKGDAVAVASLLAAGLDLDVRDDDGQTPLCAAAVAGRRELIELLLAHGADLERKGKRGMTPLLAALDAEQEDAALALLTHGSDAAAVDKNGENGLIWAAFNGCDRVVAQMLAAGADVNHRAHDGNTALADAARKGQLAVVRRLLDNGADVNAQNKAGETALTLAERAGHQAVAELLRQHGAR